VILTRRRAWLAASWRLIFSGSVWVRHNIRFAPDELQRIDDERRVAAYGAVPSRSAMIRQLINDGLLLRKSMRPKDQPRRPKGVPFPGLD
jgi:hypothetical protein